MVCLTLSKRQYILVFLTLALALAPGEVDERGPATALSPAGAHAVTSLGQAFARLVSGLRPGH